MILIITGIFIGIILTIVPAYLYGKHLKNKIQNKLDTVNEDLGIYTNNEEELFEENITEEFLSIIDETDSSMIERMEEMEMTDLAAEHKKMLLLKKEIELINQNNFSHFFE